jgi:hypothetical protein
MRYRSAVPLLNLSYICPVSYALLLTDSFVLKVTQKLTDTALIHHPLPEQLQKRDSIDSVIAVLQRFNGEHESSVNSQEAMGRIMKSLKGSLSAFNYTMTGRSSEMPEMARIEFAMVWKECGGSGEQPPKTEARRGDLIDRQNLKEKRAKPGTTNCNCRLKSRDLCHEICMSALSRHVVTPGLLYIIED